MKPEPVTEGVVVDADLAWDEEAIERAIRQAQNLEEWDMDAANQLMAQAQAAKQRLGLAGAVSLREPYDAMRTLSRMLIGYNGGVTDTCVRTMDYRRYFGLVRELDLYLEEQNKNTKTQQNNTVDSVATLNGMPKPQDYEGEVYRLI